MKAFALEQVSLAYGAAVPALFLLPMDVAMALALFKQEGLDVTATLFTAAVQHDLPVFPGDGIVNAADVRRTIDVNKAMGAIKPDQPIDIQSLYTNEFVDNVK